MRELAIPPLFGLGFRLAPFARRIAGIAFGSLFDFKQGFGLNRCFRLKLKPGSFDDAVRLSRLFVGFQTSLQRRMFFGILTGPLISLGAQTGVPFGGPRLARRGDFPTLGLALDNDGIVGGGPRLEFF